MPVIVAVRPFGKSRRRRERFLVLTSAHRAGAAKRKSKQTERPQRAIMAEWYSGGRPDMKYLECQKLSYIDYKCSRSSAVILS